MGGKATARQWRDGGRRWEPNLGAAGILDNPTRVVPGLTLPHPGGRPGRFLDYATYARLGPRVETLGEREMRDRER